MEFDLSARMGDTVDTKIDQKTKVYIYNLDKECPKMDQSGLKMTTKWW